MTQEHSGTTIPLYFYTRARSQASIPLPLDKTYFEYKRK